MQKDRARHLFSEQFYQSLDESKVNLEAIPHAQLQALAKAMADGVFAILEAAEEEGDPPLEPGAVSEEKILWNGKPYATIGTRYELTSQRLKIYTGFVNRQLEEVDLVRVRDTEVSQSLAERPFNIGDITLTCADERRPQVVLNNVKEPFEVREIIRKAYLAEHERRGLRFRDES